MAELSSKEISNLPSILMTWHGYNDGENELKTRLPLLTVTGKYYHYHGQGPQWACLVNNSDQHITMAWLEKEVEGKAKAVFDNVLSELKENFQWAPEEGRVRFKVQKEG